MSNGTNVRKRSGSIESLNLNKMHKMVDEACKDLAGVSASQGALQEYSNGSKCTGFAPQIGSIFFRQGI